MTHAIAGCLIHYLRFREHLLVCANSSEAQVILRHSVEEPHLSVHSPSIQSQYHSQGLHRSQYCLQGLHQRDEAGISSTLATRHQGTDVSQRLVGSTFIPSRVRSSAQSLAVSSQRLRGLLVNFIQSYLVLAQTLSWFSMDWNSNCATLQAPTVSQQPAMGFSQGAPYCGYSAHFTVGMGEPSKLSQLCSTGTSMGLNRSLSPLFLGQLAIPDQRSGPTGSLTGFLASTDVLVAGSTASSDLPYHGL